MKVYCVTNKINDKCYVGITMNDVADRWQMHVWKALNESKYKFHRAIRKYGSEVFEVRILEECSSVEDLKRAECDWIQKLDSYAHGYNATLGGDGVFGCQWSSESRAKARNAKVGKTLSAEHKRKISKSLKKRFQDHPRPKRILSDATKQKLSEAAKQAWNTPEIRAKIVAGQLVNRAGE